MFEHIAEFYNYLGQLIVTAAVYRGLGVGDSPAFRQRPSHLGLLQPRISLGPPLHAYPRMTITWAPLACLVSPSVKRKRRGTGISTCWPSTTPFGLALGPD